MGVLRDFCLYSFSDARKELNCSASHELLRTQHSLRRATASETELMSPEISRRYANQPALCSLSRKAHVRARGVREACPWPRRSQD